MTSRLVGTGLPLPPLPDEDVRGGGKMRSDVLSVLAARERWISEFIDGSVASGNTRCAPLNGMGNTTSHDHSGGVMGRPIIHSFGWMSFGWGLGSLANVTYGEAIYQQTTNAVPGPTTVGTPRNLYNGPWRVYCPPVATAASPGWSGAAGAYNLVDAGFSIRHDAGAGAVDLNITLENCGVNQTFTRQLSGVGDTHVRSSVSGIMVPMSPGMFNTVYLRIEVEYVSTSPAYVSLSSACFHQVKDKAVPFT